MKDIKWMRLQIDEHTEVFQEKGQYLGLKGMVDVNLINELLFELDTLETTIIPKFVAVYIDERKTAGDKLIHAIHCTRNTEVFTWLLKDDNGELFARAWIDGYIVKETERIIQNDS